MSKGAYLTCLLLAIASLVVLDYRYKLVLWQNARRAVGITVMGVMLFLAWDIAGIHLNIFAVGNSRYMTGIQLMPNLPVEEPIFLVLLMYQTMLVSEGVRRWYAR